MTGYDSLYGAWRDDPLGYWAEQASRIDWETPWSAVSTQTPALTAAGSRPPA